MTNNNQPNHMKQYSDTTTATKPKPAKRKPRRRPANPNISKEAMAAILIDLEKNDCRTPLQRLEKAQQLAVLGFSDRQIAKMTKPRPFDREKIKRDVRAIQERELRQLRRTQNVQDSDASYRLDSSF